MIEYTMILILIVIACMGGIALFQSSLAQNFNFVSSSIGASLSGGS